jgi:hypothetical protein
MEVEEQAAAGSACAAAAGGAPAVAQQQQAGGVDTRDELYNCDVPSRDAIFREFKSTLQSGAMDQRYVSTVKLSGLASTKIMMHAKKGVDEGATASARSLLRCPALLPQQAGRGQLSAPAGVYKLAASSVRRDAGGAGEKGEMGGLFSRRFT